MIPATGLKLSELVEAELRLLAKGSTKVITHNQKIQSLVYGSSKFRIKKFLLDVDMTQH